MVLCKSKTKAKEKVKRRKIKNEQTQKAPKTDRFAGEKEEVEEEEKI